MDALLHSMTSASEALQAPNTSPEERRKAEVVLGQLKVLDDPGPVFRFIFERSSNSLVLFNAATILKDVVARGHKSFVAANVAEELREYFLRYLLANPTAIVPVRQQILAIVAVLLKRSWVSHPQESGSSLRRYVNALIVDDVAKQNLALSLLAAVIVEFAWGSNAAATGMSVESHLIVKQSFEAQLLQYAFTTVVQVFQTNIVMLSETKGLDHARSSLLDAALNVAEQVLSWQFTAHKTDSALRALQQEAMSTYFRGDSSWQSVVTQDTISLFFQAYILIRESPTSGHLLRQCLSQLVSARQIHLGAASEQQFFISILSGFSTIILQYPFSEITSGEELLGWAVIFERIVNALGFERMISLCGTAEVQRFLEAGQTMTTFSFRYMATGNDDDGGHDGEGCTGDAVNAIFNAWVGMVHSSSGISHVDIRPTIHAVLVTYLESRMIKAARDAEDDAEVAEELDGDALLYEHQLCGFSFLSRRYIENIWQVISDLLSTKLDTFSQSLNAVQVDGMQLAKLSEELHWCLLITGYFFTDSDVGERDVIPPQIMKASAQTPEGSESLDPFVRLSIRVLTCAQEIRDAADNCQTDRISSAVVADVMWWLHRWSRAYLMMKESRYTEVLSLALIESFGEGSPGGSSAIDLIFSCACSVLLVWQGDKEIVEACVDILDAITERKSLQSALMQCPTLWTFAEGFRDPLSRVGKLPAEIQTFVAKALCKLCGAAGSEDRLKLFKHLIEPTHETFLGIIQRPGFGPKMAQTPEIQVAMSRTIHVLCGLARAITRATASLFFGYFKDMLEALVGLLPAYFTTPEVFQLLMRLFVDLLKYSSHHIEEKEHPFLFGAMIAATRHFLDNLSRLSSSSGISNENEFAEQAQLLVDLLVASSRVPCYSDSGVAEVNSAGGLIFTTLDRLVPLLTPNILAVPELTKQYFTLVTWVSQEYADEAIANGQIAMLILSTIEHGMGTYGDDITRMTFQSSCNIASSFAKSSPSNQDIGLLLGRLSDKVFRMIMVEPMNTSLETTGAEALFALICCNHVQFRKNVQSLVDSHSDPHLSRRISESFETLSCCGFQLVPDRPNKAMFTKGFKTLLEAIKGSILVR